MVSWIEGTDGRHGSVVGCIRDITTGEVFTTASAYPLASPGTVDLNGATRFQYYSPLASLPYPMFQGQANLNYDAADIAGHAGWYFTATAFRAPATTFAEGYVPTPNQIRASADLIVRGNENRTTAGDLEVSFAWIPYADVEPNTKWWWAIIPTAVSSWGSTPSLSNDAPLGGTPEEINAIGRAVSLWNNRTPEAPLITAPTSAVECIADAVVDLRFTPQDPDAITFFPGDSEPNHFADLAGLHIQYARVPTEDDPDPVWTDLPIADSTGSVLGRGWHIDNAFTTPANDGVVEFWNTWELPILCAPEGALTPYAGVLPTAGDWQIRLRTYDYGNGDPAFTDDDATWTEASYETYPTANTSPWSEPVLISILSRVLPPVPMSPAFEAAVAEDESVVLTWRYRNTRVPPYPQATRTVQIREAGDPDWTTLIEDDAAASASYAVSGFEMVSGNRYEWRVKVTDSGGAESDYSDSAFFWLVPTPDVPPGPPGSTIDGAALGCGTHIVHIYRRGGKRFVAEISDISLVEWNRTRDDMSTARVVVSGWGTDCGKLLASLRSWAYEVVIFRNNGFSVDRVWEGPITLLTYERDTVTIHAKDVMAYAYRRIVKQAMNDFGNTPTAGDTVVSRAERVLRQALAPDDPNVLAHLQALHQDDDAKQYRSMPEYSRTAFEEVDDMAANAGLDYTAVGRAILLWGTRHRIGTLPEFRDKDLGSSPIVSEYGMSMANRYVVSDGNGIWGEATRLDGDGQDSVHGLVEMLSSTWASEGEEDTGTYTEAGKETMRQSFAESAERSIADRYPPPVVVRVPDNTSLNPETVISIQHLVPGVVIPLRSTSTLRTLVASQKLDAVKVIETGGTETITITMSPFSRDDGDLGEGEGE